MNCRIPFNVEFINNLKQYRKEKNLTQAKLAELCGVSTATISGIESFQNFASMELVYKIAEVMKINPADLFIKDCSNKDYYRTYKSYPGIIHKLSEVPESKKDSLNSVVIQICDAYITHPSGENPSKS